jgi:hypothetical protein
MNWLSRYCNGEYAAVWNELAELGPAVRQGAVLQEARAVADETMRRVRYNIEVLVPRLSALGYRYNVPEIAHEAPRGDVERQLRSIEQRLGPLPLSLYAFYAHVGSVDLSQSCQQIVHYSAPNRDTASEVEILGEEDPLVVAPLEELDKEINQPGRRVYFCFAADEFFKANYGGGENYHVWLPDARADFEIVGMCDDNERFVDYLRTTFAHGGFRGKLEPLADVPDLAHKVPPKLAIARELAKGLLPI